MNGLIVLFDYDSLIYQAVYKIASFGDIRGWFRDGRDREWMKAEILNLSINRLTNMGDNIFYEIEETGIIIQGIEYYITVGRNSRRKAISKTYKANRTPNKWVNIVRRHLVEMEFAITSNEWEADDLIYDRAVELGEAHCIILSIDKDLKQIPGIHYNYYKPIRKDENGFRIETDMVGLDMVTKKEAEHLFWKQMLMGDGADNIKGIHGLGPKKSEKILSESENYQETVRDIYIEKFGNDELFTENYFLLKLGVR